MEGQSLPMSELWFEAVILGVAVWLLTGNPLAAAGLALMTVVIGFTAYHAGYGDGALAEIAKRGHSESEAFTAESASAVAASSEPH
jgi:hypothetical protein